MEIKISDYEAAKIWKNEVEAEIEETKALLDRVGKSLQRIKDDADGTIVDEVYKYGTDFLKFTVEVEKGMKSVADSIGNFLKKFNNLTEKALNSVGSAIRGIKNFTH